MNFVKHSYPSCRSRKKYLLLLWKSLGKGGQMRYIPKRNATELGNSMPNTVKILIVDDEPDLELLILQKFRKQIAAKEYFFVFARNGKEALTQLFQDSEINIIVTDINMPEMDGITLLSNLHAINRPYKAIVMSAYGDMQNIRSAMNQGASEFITKPIDFQDLEITIKKIIQQYEQQREGDEAKARLKILELELTIANAIQQSLLPSDFDPLPANGHFELAGRMRPARAIGGDFFDFFPLDPNRLGLLIADVSGKSIAASLFMAKSKTVVRSIALQGVSPEETLRKSNEILASDNSSCMFVTLFYAILDTTNGLITYANAGHNPPYIVSANRQVRQLPATDTIPLGLDPSLIHDGLNFFQQTTVPLKDKDFLFLYTDGVTEALNAKGEFYTNHRLEAVLAANAEKALEEVIDMALRDNKDFSEGVEQSDDIAILCTRYYQEAIQGSFLRYATQNI